MAEVRRRVGRAGLAAAEALLAAEIERQSRPELLPVRGEETRHAAEVVVMTVRQQQGVELRDYLSGDYLLLYAFMQRTVYLLSIRHHRQLSVDFERLWTEGH